MSIVVVRLTMLKRLFRRAIELLNKTTELLNVTDPRYLSVPLWKPWRDL